VLAPGSRKEQSISDLKKKLIKALHNFYILRLKLHRTYDSLPHTCIPWPGLRISRLLRMLCILRRVKVPKQDNRKEALLPSLVVEELKVEIQNPGIVSSLGEPRIFVELFASCIFSFPAEKL
jgi:hypothetical protein